MPRSPYHAVIQGICTGIRASPSSAVWFKAQPVMTKKTTNKLTATPIQRCIRCRKTPMVWRLCRATRDNWEVTFARVDGNTTPRAPCAPLPKPIRSRRRCRRCVLIGVVFLQAVRRRTVSGTPGNEPPCRGFRDRPTRALFRYDRLR